MVFTVQMISGPPVILTVYQDTCLSVEWRTRECSYGAPCRVTIPTTASHPVGDNWYVTISSLGGSAFKFHVDEYLANCKVPALDATSFCGNGLVTYSAWAYQNITARDAEAEARFEYLVDKFTCAKTEECYDAIHRYVCYESFKRCDIMTGGFYVGLCTSACMDIEYACGSFCTYGVPALDCSSDRYLDLEPCTGTGSHVTTTGSSTFVTTTLNPTTGGNTGSTTATGRVSSASVASIPIFFTILLTIFHILC
jgi:hypothetical protein